MFLHHVNLPTYLPAHRIAHSCHSLPMPPERLVYIDFPGCNLVPTTACIYIYAFSFPVHHQTFQFLIRHD